MKKSLLTMALAACMAVPGIVASPATTSAVAPRRSVDTPAHVAMKSHAATEAVARMPKARALASPNGFYCDVAIPSVRKAAANASAELPELYGSVIYADGWTTQANEIGMYRIGTSDAVPFERMGTARVDATAGGVAVGDTYWASYMVDIYGSYFAYTQKFDLGTWVEDTGYDFWSSMQIMSTGVAYDRSTGNIYGCFYDDDARGYVFGTVDYVVKKRTAIKKLERMWSAVAVTRKGQLYAIDDTGMLYSVDKSTGDMTPVGDTGLLATNPSSACIDPRSGRCFYAVVQGSDGSLYEIDLNTAKATLIYHFPKNQEVVGMFVPMPDADDNAPDAVTDLRLDFTKGSLSGTVSFTAPATTFDGTPAEGSLNYVVEANDITMASGTTAYGWSVDAPIAFSAPGNYTFKVYVSNSVGNGPAAEASMFVGNDLPLAPELTATMTDGVVTLSWEPVASSANGGYIDVENLTYKVTRLPDNHQVAAATRLTTVTDTPPASGTLTGYWYVVTAHSGAYSSADAVSRKFWIGSLTPPYSVMFDTAAKGEAFVVHDVNNDGSTWAWSEADKAFKTQFNRRNAMDDWLVTPPLKLQKGKMYMFTAKMRTYLGNPLNVEIRCGRGDTPDAMTEVLMAPQQIKNRDSKDYSFYLLPDADGIYHVGIHEVTPADNSWFLFVDGVSVSAGAEAVIPDVVTEFSVTPDFNGGKTAVVSFKAPAVAVNGSELAKLTRIDVLRNGVVIKTFPEPGIGAPLDFTDEVPEIGYYQYDVVPFNEAGQGKKTGTTVFVGPNEPARPAWVKIAETENPGEVTLTWERVTTDKDGNSMNPDLVTYTIIAAGDGEEPVLVAENIKGTSHTFQALEAGVEQSFVGYGLRAQTEGGYSLMAVTDLIPVGTPYAAPWSESFAGGEAQSLFRSDNREAMWNIYTDNAGIPSCDGDGGMAAMFGEFSGADATLYSGKISLDGLENPVLMFYTYNIADDTEGDQNELEVAVNGGNGFEVEKTVLTWTLGAEEGWYLVVVPLEKYKGKSIQFSLRGITYTRKFTLVDNIRVTSLEEHNLRIVSINAPSAVQPGKEFFVTVNVDNPSVNEASNYDVKLFRNGRQVAIECPASLGVGRTIIVKFPQTLSVADDEAQEYYAVVEYARDVIASDNTSRKLNVRMIHFTHPVPVNLSGKADVNSVSLSWEAPDLASAVPDRVTEDFEGFDSWATTGAHGWVFVDVDQSPVGQIGNYVLPGIDYKSNQSWFVTDATLAGLPSDFAASSGNKYLSTLFCLPNSSGDVVEYVVNDDWAISPLLYGGAQSVSLMARSLNPYEAEESFEILVSKTDSESTGDFTLLQKVENVPGEWTPYSFELPEGTRRFAIRYNHTFGLSLGIDDVSFIPDGGSSLVLEGYNVYRDGLRVNTSPVTETSFVEFVQLMGKVTYNVSAVYGEAGESRLSEPLYLGGAGIESVSAAGEVSVAAVPGVIVVTGADGLTVVVSDLSGRVIATRNGAARLEIPVCAGFYLVKAGGTAFKVRVP